MQYLYHMFWKLLIVTCILPVFAYSQPGTEILLFDLEKDKNGKYVIRNARNITNHKGYDNQPFFHPKRPEVYYASAIDSTNVEIMVYDIKAGKARQFSFTPENEFSPTVTPDQQFISCIIQRRNGAQDLGKFPVMGKDPVILESELKVGYHAWADKSKLLLFVLADSANFLFYYDTKLKQKKIIAQNIGRSLHKIPNRNAVSYIEKEGTTRAIRWFNANTKASGTITSGLPGREDVCWNKDGALFISDGTKLYSFLQGKDSTWQEVTIEGDTSAIKNVTRLAINAAGNKLAMVVTE